MDYQNHELGYKKNKNKKITGSYLVYHDGFTAMQKLLKKKKKSLQYSTAYIIISAKSKHIISPSFWIFQRIRHKTLNSIKNALKQPVIISPLMFSKKTNGKPC